MLAFQDDAPDVLEGFGFGAALLAMFMRVDLPAPFSPTIAWIVPRATSMLMSSFAITPGNRLPIPRRRTAGATSDTRTPSGPENLTGKISLGGAQTLRADEHAIRRWRVHGKPQATPAGADVACEVEPDGSGHGAVGTEISPSMICCFSSSSWSTMSSTKPPLVE